MKLEVKIFARHPNKKGQCCWSLREKVLLPWYMGEENKIQVYTEYYCHTYTLVHIWRIKVSGTYCKFWGDIIVVWFCFLLLNAAPKQSSRDILCMQLHFSKERGKYHCSESACCSVAMYPIACFFMVEVHAFWPNRVPCTIKCEDEVWGWQKDVFITTLFLYKFVKNQWHKQKMHFGHQMENLKRTLRLETSR